MLSSQCFSPNQISLLQIFALLFGIKCTETNQSQSSNISMYIIIRIITYLTYKCWEIDNFVIKSDIFRQFFIYKNILKKLSCYHDNNIRYIMFGKCNGFVNKARVSACMYFHSLRAVPYYRLALMQYDFDM
jgi:hypothetical protein